MTQIIQYEGQRHAFPDDFTDADIAAALSTVSQPDKSFGESVGELWSGTAKPVPEQVRIPLPGGREFRPSLIGMAKTAWEGINAPGRAVRGEFEEPPAKPGILTEEDIARQRMGSGREADAARNLAATLIMGQSPGGIFAAPQGALASGIARTGTPRPAAPAPAGGMPPASPAQVVEAAERIGVPVSRYMVSENRIDQGFAAGLQNIPGAGDPIAKAAETTFRALGGAADKVREGFGTGSAAVGGSYAKDALVEWMTTGSKKVASRVYDAVDNLVNPVITTELKSTRQMAQSILDRRANARIPGQSAAVNSVMDAATAPRGLNYQGLKDLRTFIGDMTPDEIVAQGLKAAEVKQLYGALTSDLRSAVQQAGGSKALDVFNKANSIFEKISDRRKMLTKIVGAKADAAPEAVFSRLLGMAGSRSNADAQRLFLARKAMGAEAWDEVASAVVARLGRDPKGNFSIDRFLGANGYSGLSPNARTALFRTTGKDSLATALDDIAFVSKEIEAKLAQFRNPSGTGRSVVSTETAMDIIHAPQRVLATLVGGTRLARILSEPAGARATADWMRSLYDAIVAPSAGASKKTQAAAEQLAQHITRQHGGNPAALAAELQSINAALMSDTARQ